MDDVDREPGSAPPPPPPLPWFPEDWSTALAVAAHPDDLEYLVAPAVARWTAAGRRVAYLLLTRGEAGIDTLPPEEAGPLREREQRQACAEVGVEDVAFADNLDGVLVAGPALRRDVARAVRRVRPEVVVTPGTASWGGVPDQADHRAVADVVLDGVRDAGNRWVHRELLDEGLEPWSGVRAVVYGAGRPATHAVDVTGQLDRAAASLRAHATYFGVLDSDPVPYVRDLMADAGRRQGVPHAVRVRVVAL